MSMVTEEPSFELAGTHVSTAQSREKRHLCEQDTGRLARAMIAKEMRCLERFNGISRLSALGA